MTENTEQATLVHLTIDGREVTVPKGTTVYQATKQLGIEIPIFCYQDRMPVFGACRVCLVEVEKMVKLQTSCTLEAVEGMVVKTQSTLAVDGRRSILEFLLINHPLDCPICDRAGECPLQDQVLQFGPGESRFYEEKRHFKKPIPLGPVLMLDRERCIQCARCTRFGDVVSGDHALEFIDRGYRMEVGTHDGGPVQSKFIGNTIMICPVGALTSQVYRFRARPWDNKSTKSTCTLCPVGCSMILDSRDGEIMRTRTCENKAVNDIWMCDLGWFGYEFTSSEARLTQPLIRRNGELQPASWNEALDLIADKIKSSMAEGKLAGLGGTPLMTEENYLFQKLMRDVVGVNHLDYRVGLPLYANDVESGFAGMEMSIGDCENLSHIVLLGLDITEEFPIIWLRLKNAINHGAKVLYIGHYLPEIAQFIHQSFIHAPGNELEMIKHVAPFLAENQDKDRAAIFIGSQYLNSPNRQSLLNQKNDFKNTSFNVMEGHGNSMGARLAGMLPDFGPLGQPSVNPGKNALQVVEEAAKKGWDFLYVAGANPAVKFSNKLWMDARKQLKFLVVQDLFLTETAKQADVVLPTLSYVEKTGTFINIEGRLQKVNPGKNIPHDIYSDGEIFRWLAEKLGHDLVEEEAFSEALRQERLASFQFKANVNNEKIQEKGEGSLLATFAHVLFDHGVRMMHNPHVKKLAKESYIRINAQEASKRKLVDGQMVVIKSDGNTIKAKLKIEKTVADGTVVLPLGFPDVPVYDLGRQLYNGLPVEIEAE